MDAPVALGDTPLTDAGVKNTLLLERPSDHHDCKGGKQALQMLRGVAGEVNHEF